MKKILLTFSIWLLVFCLEAAPPVERNQFSTNTVANSQTFTYNVGGLTATGTVQATTGIFSNLTVNGTQTVGNLFPTNITWPGKSNGVVGIAANGTLVKTNDISSLTATNPTSWSGVTLNGVTTNLGSALNQGGITNNGTVINNGVVTNNGVVMNLGVVTNNTVVVNKGGVTNESLVTFQSGANMTGGGMTNNGTGFYGNGINLSNMVYPQYGMLNGITFTSQQVKYGSLFGELQAAAATTEGNVAVPIAIQAPFILTNFVVGSRAGTLGVGTNLTLRIFTNGVQCAPSWVITGSATSVFTTNDTTSSLVINGTSWTNVYSMQVSNNTSGNTVSINALWGFQIVK